MTETYSIISDFGGVDPNTTQLHTEIEAESGITKTLLSVNTLADVVDIIFDLALSVGEKTLLDNIVTNHVPNNNPETNKTIVLTPRSANSKNSTFRRMGTFYFPGTTYATAKSISYLNSGATSYDILIFDLDNNQELLNTNLTNTSEMCKDLGELTNVSPNPTRVEISIKRNGGNSSKKVHLESITISYV